MPVQNSSIKTVTLPADFFNRTIEDSRELKKRYEAKEKEGKVTQQYARTLEARIIELENRNAQLEAKEAKSNRLVQHANENEQSAKTALQYICTIAGAVLAGGATLAFPPFGAAAIGTAAALGAGSAAVSVSTVGVAFAGGATGYLVGGVTGHLVAPAVHEQHNPVAQQANNQIGEEPEVNQVPAIN